MIAKPASVAPKVPPGFQVELFATDLRDPRVLRLAPNGHIFIAESEPGRIRVLRAADGAAKPSSNDVFASGLDQPFGIAFYPSGPDPQWIYVANTGSVVRYPYRNGDLKARGKAEVIVRNLPGAGGRSVQRGHITRDIAFSKDGRQMFVSVGSASNNGEGMGKRDTAAIAGWEAEHGLGSAWGSETDRAAVLVFDTEGRKRRVFASGLRNCVGLALHPLTGDLWCSTNERDGLGDDLVPDFITRVRDGAFYGWPWYYLGANEDPRRRALSLLECQLFAVSIRVIAGAHDNAPSSARRPAVVIRRRVTSIGCLPASTRSVLTLASRRELSWRACRR